MDSSVSKKSGVCYQGRREDFYRGGGRGGGTCYKVIGKTLGNYDPHFICLMLLSRGSIASYQSNFFLS